MQELKQWIELCSETISYVGLYVRIYKMTTLHVLQAPVEKVISMYEQTASTKMEII